MTGARLRIGRIARLLQTTTKTLRFYEAAGLLPPPVRSESGYRLYDDAAVARARLVLGLRKFDLSIQELKELLAPGAEGSLRRRLTALMDDKLSDIYLRIGVLQGRCDELAARHQALMSTPRERPPGCICDALFVQCTCITMATKGNPAGVKSRPSARNGTDRHRKRING